MSYQYSQYPQLQWPNPHQTSQALTLSKMSEHTSEFLDSLPPNLASRVRQLLSMQSRQSQLMEQYQHEVLQLDKKYLSLYTPLYTERREAIDTTNSIASDFDTAISSAAADDADIPNGIPEFWLTVIRNNFTTSNMITEEDEDALKSLKDVRLEYHEEPGFRLIFEFAENEFFDNTTLSKTFFYTRDEEDYTRDLVYGHSIGEEIRWKEGKNLMRKVVRTKRRKGKVHEETVPKESFFDFFSSLIEPASDDAEEGERDTMAGGDEEDGDDPDSEFQWLLELDFGYGEAFKEEIIPYAVHWFTGEASQFDEEDSEEDSEEEDDDEEEEDEDGDEEEEEEDDDDDNDEE